MEIEPWRPTRRTALGLIGAAAGTAALPGTAAAAAAAPAVGVAADDGVTLVDNGANVTLANALISIVVDKATGHTTSIRLTGSLHGNADVNLVSGQNGGGYSTFNYTLGTSAVAKDISGGVYRLVSQSPERVEIAITADDPATLPFLVELHIALEQGSPGVYYWMVYRYPTEMPDGAIIAQLRYAVAAGDPSFQYFIVDDKRGVQQRPANPATWLTLQDTTYALPDGSVYTKYQNISDLEGDNHAFLISNGRVGMAVVQASKEYFNGGPTKQELTCHDYFNGMILLWHPFTSHYGSPALVPPKGWEKIYGPFFLHVVESDGSTDDPVAGTTQMWAQTKQRALLEQARWPYAWLDDPLYAADTRSAVTGRLSIAGGASAESAWVVLSAPGQDWQYESLDYVYSVRADAHGRFSVPAVRPGSYTLTAFVSGVLGEFKKFDVVVEAGRRTHLGELRWRPVTHGKTLWQIGTPDRSAGEFHIFGGPQGFRKYLTWLEYPYEFPDGVDFKVGRDDITRDWNFFQPMYRTPGTPAELAWRGTTQDFSLTTWKIRFDSTGYARGTATLDIALASSVFGTLKIALNGTELVAVDPLPGPPGDNASYRVSRRGMYRQLSAIAFPAEFLIAGENVITLSPVRPPKAPLTAAGTVDDWMEPMGGIMYDVIRLQIDERTTCHWTGKRPPRR